MIIVSACLAGIDCKWNGKNWLNKEIKEMVENGRAIAACPEVLGGLPTPRKPTGIYGGLGEDVLNGKAKVIASRDGEDMTSSFIRGAKEFLKLVQSKKIETAILRNKSPSCGCGKTWQLDEKLKNHLVVGDGVTTALLKKNGIKVYTEEKFK